MADSLRYAAFISYSSKDTAFVRRLHRALEGYRIPKTFGPYNLIEGGRPNRIYPVFRDRDELPAGQLGEVIEDALKLSGALIVVCSPDAASSVWVEKEINYFSGVRSDRMFAIIADSVPDVIDGADAINACFPSALRKGAIDLIAGDSRKSKDGFRNAWLKCVAGLVSLPLGKLIDRDLATQRKRQALGGIALLIAALLLTVVAAGFARIVQQQAWRNSNTLAELSASSARSGYFGAARRYALAGMVGFNRPVIGFPPDAATSQLIQSVAEIQRGSADLAAFRPRTSQAFLSSGIFVRLIDIESGGVAHEFNVVSDATVDYPGHGDDSVTALSVSSDGNLFVTTSGEAAITCVWRFNANKALACRASEKPFLVGFGEAEGGRRPLGFIPDDSEKTLDVIDLVTGQRISQLIQVPEVYGPETMKISPDERKAIIIHQDESRRHMLHLFDFIKGGPELRAMEDISGSDTTVVNISPNGERVLAAGRDSTGETETGYGMYFDLSTGRVVWSLEGMTLQAINQARHSPDGSLLALGLGNEALLLNAADGKPIRTLTGHLDKVTDVTFSPNGSMIATASLDHTIRVWDSRTGAEMARFRGHAAVSAAFNHDGTLLMTRAEHGTVKVWSIDRALTLRGERLVTATCAEPGADGTPAEVDETLQAPLFHHNWDARTRLSEAELQNAPMLDPKLNADPCRLLPLATILSIAFGF